VGSLSRNTLYLLKTEGDDIVYAEPTPLSGYRLRDIISLRDGRIAILADGGTLLLLRNLERHADKPKRFEVTGLTSLPSYIPEFIYTNPVDRGRHYFLRACAHCHSLNGEMGVGPPLDGVAGRRIAEVPKFGYSPALAGQRGTWNDLNLNAFILNPVGFAPGTTMSEPGLWESEVAEVVVYLKTVK
jgi:cytochrome c2